MNKDQENEKKNGFWSGFFQNLAIMFMYLIFFVLGFIFSRTYGKDIDILKEPPRQVSEEKSDTINRTSKILYPAEEYGWKTGVEIIYKSTDIYYHSPRCFYCKFANRYLSKNYSEAVITISLYEAVERGYKPCPNCASNESSLQGIERDVSELYNQYSELQDDIEELKKRLE